MLQWRREEQGQKKKKKTTIHPELIITQPREMGAVKLNGQPAPARSDTWSFSHRDEAENDLTHMVLGFLYLQKPHT